MAKAPDRNLSFDLLETGCCGHLEIVPSDSNEKNKGTLAENFPKLTVSGCVLNLQSTCYLRDQFFFIYLFQNKFILNQYFQNRFFVFVVEVKILSLDCFHDHFSEFYRHMLKIFSLRQESLSCQLLHCIYDFNVGWDVLTLLYFCSILYRNRKEQSKTSTFLFKSVLHSSHATDQIIWSNCHNAMKLFWWCLPRNT